MSLKNLFRDGMDSTIQDDEGQKVPIRVQSLKYRDNIEIGEIMDEVRADISKRVDTNEARRVINVQYEGWPKERLVDQILDLERQHAIAVSDLAPSDEDEAEFLKQAGQTAEDFKKLSEKERQEIKEKRVVERWEKERRQVLMGMEDELVLRSMVIERRVQLAINSQVQERFVQLSLTRCVVDPVTRKPMLTDDPTPRACVQCQVVVRRQAKYCDGCGTKLDQVLVPEDLVFIGDLMPRTRGEIVSAWSQFMSDMSEKGLRKLVERRDFLSRGRSASAPADSPGETTETSSTSPLPQSTSSPNEVGLTK